MKDKLSGDLTEIKFHTTLSSLKIEIMIALQNYGTSTINAKVIVAQRSSTVYTESAHQTVILRLMKLNPVFVCCCATLFKFTPPRKL